MAVFEARGPSVRCQWILGAVALLFLWVLVATNSAQAQTPAVACPPPSTSSVGAPLSTAPSIVSLNPAPEQVVACVGARSITGATFSHWADVVRRSGGKHLPSAAEVKNEVMGFLVSSDWVLGEAADLNIDVSEAKVRHTFNRIRDEQFPKRREFKVFLRKSGQTVADLLFRVRLNLLSTGASKSSIGRYDCCQTVATGEAAQLYVSRDPLRSLRSLRLLRFVHQ
jgi:hypothetical protein